MSPSFNVGQSLTLDPRAQASNANAQSQEMTPKMEGGSGSPFRRCSGAMGGPEESPPYVRVAGGDDDVLLAISEASEFTEITPEKG